MANTLSNQIEIEEPELSPSEKGQQDKSLTDSEKEIFIQQRRDLAVKLSAQKDLVDGRYQIKGKEILKPFSSSFADAFRVADQKEANNTDLYALVLDKRYAINLEQINALLGKSQYGFCNILAAALTDLSFKSGSFYVVVVEKPKGITLAEYMKKHGPAKEEFIIDKIVAPIGKVLNFLHRNNVMHGHINLENIYIDEKEQIFVPECVSMICGFHQVSLYETLHRSTCLPACKDYLDFKADFYALGVTANLMLLGMNPYQKLPDQEVTRLKFAQNTYSMLSKNLQLSPHMLDMLRGTINDNPQELWGYEHVEQWCKGKRFNLLPQSNRTEATRAIEFSGQKFVNRRHLAYELYLNWDDAKGFISTDQLSKWVDRSVQDPELAEKLELSRSRAGSQIFTEGFDAKDILLAETLLLLDPTAPLRIKQFACSITGFGPALAYAYANDKGNIKHLIRCALQYGLIFSWTNISAQLSEKYYQYELFALQRCADMVTKSEIGFGLERCLYELNASICCQSSHVYDDNIITMRRLLELLNGPKKIEGDLIDRHIAAFLSNRLELPSQIQIKSLKRFPDIANDMQIQTLAFYALAQQKTKIKTLPGLAEKLQQRLEVIIEQLRSKYIREKIYDAMKTPVKQGLLVKLLQAVTNINLIYKDRSGFKNAKKAYYVKTEHILNLSNRKAIANMGYRHGLQMALVLSFLVASIVTLTLIIKVF